MNGVFRRAFSLVEIAIICVVVALLVGGLLAGNSLRERAKNMQLSAEIESLMQAIHGFEHTYHGLPGDLWNASQLLFSAQPIQNGNGNGKIDSVLIIAGMTEQTLSMQHLILAGLLTGDMDGTWKPAFLRPGPLDGSKYFLDSLPTGEVVLCLARVYDANQDGLVMTAAEHTYSVISATQLSRLDMAFDDGKPDTGAIRAQSGSDVAATACASAGAYQPTDALVCVPSFLVHLAAS